MKTGIKVGDVMTKKFISVIPSTTISECAKTMAKKHVGSLIIKENQKLRGIVTEGDIMQAVAKGLDLKKTPVSKIMTKHVISISPSKDLYESLMIMKRKGIRWLPVVIDNNIIGLLTEKDILKIQPDLFDIAIQNIKIAEEEEKWKRVRAVDEYRWVREGPCQECGVYDLLYKIGNRYLCASCRKTEAGEYEE
ncbi:MAG: CBS domain-containing protein [Candidatus Pacearchaeota archaeon]|nr:CBS domain-containing protein [Candidatus Pacearchaeota archaeon]